MTARSAWPVVRLGDHVDLLAGYAFKSSGFTDNPEDVPLVKGDNVQQGYIDWGRAKRWSRDAAPAMSKFRLESGDVVLAMDRPWVEAGLKLAWIKGSDPEALLVQRVSRLRGVNGLDTTFMRYVLCGQSFTNYIRPIVTGINVPHISPGQIRDFKFILPPLAAQHRIASILSAYDDLIENNTRRINILEEMARRIYEEWFVRFRFPGHERVKRVESELGLIPEGWQVTNLDAVSEYINRGLTPKYDELADGIVINQKCIRGQKLSYELVRRQSKPIPADKRVRYGDVLVNSTGVGTLGRVAQVLDERPDCTVDTHVTIVRPGKQVTTHFYGLSLLAREEYFEQQGVGATGQTELGRARVAGTTFIVPPLVVQEQFDELVAPMRQLTVRLTSKNANLRATRDLLLPKLISGELDVSTLSEPEPVREMEAAA